MISAMYETWLDWQIALRCGRIQLYPNGRINWDGFASKQERDHFRLLWRKLCRLA